MELALLKLAVVEANFRKLQELTQEAADKNPEIELFRDIVGAFRFSVGQVAEARAAVHAATRKLVQVN